MEEGRQKSAPIIEVDDDDKKDVNINVEEEKSFGTAIDDKAIHGNEQQQSVIDGDTSLWHPQESRKKTKAGQQQQRFKILSNKLSSRRRLRLERAAAPLRASRRGRER